MFWFRRKKLVGSYLFFRATNRSDRFSMFNKKRDIPATTKRNLMSEKASISFRCKRCGTKIGWPEDAVDSTKITCKNCGAEIGTYGNLRHASIEAVRVTDIFKNAFKRR
jgi:DNA-directed RNA polymerase subunit RPC12/RpoP